MLHELGRRSTPPLFFVIALGVATPAYADLEPEPETPESPEGKKAKKRKKGGNCSVDDSKLELAGLAALVLLISGASLRRRRP